MKYIPKDKFNKPKDGEFNVHIDIQKSVRESFEKQADPEKIKMTLRGLTQNMNESCHARLFNIVHKVKYYKLPRYIFAAQHVAIENNFGKLAASLFPEIGELTPQEKQDLEAADREMLRSAKRKKNPENGLKFYSWTMYMVVRLRRIK